MVINKTAIITGALSEVNAGVAMSLLRHLLCQYPP
jgi:hypothetical protein